MGKILILLLLLSGCQTWNSKNYNDYLQKYVGMDTMNLYENWGSPDNVYRITSNKQEVTYISSYSAPIGSQRMAYIDSGINYDAIETGYGTGLENSSALYYCETSFTIENNVVTDYTFNGDDCVAK